MTVLWWILTVTLIGSVGAILGASFILLFPAVRLKALVSPLVSYATGTLLGSAFLGMLPKALQRSSPLSISVAVLSGILLFFLLEKLVIWRHCHEEACEVHTRAGPLILFGDAFHNLVDGVVITAAFLTDISLGVITSVSVFAHELPQEIGDFAILLDSGYTKGKAFFYNLLSQATSLLGAVIAYYYLKAIQASIPYVLALSAASFIYIALADLIPGLQRNRSEKGNLLQFGLVLSGVGTILFFLLHHG
jgi:zinc and cadmium transporter